MSDGSPSTIMDILNYLWVGFVGLFLWNGRRLVARVDEVEKNHVKERTFNDTLQALRQDIKDVSKEVRQDINEIHHRIDKLVDK